MSGFENATRFFHACESLEGWAGCAPYVAPGATFASQCEPLAEIATVEDYCEWMKAFGTQVTPGCRYEIRAASFDDERRVATFFAVFEGKHTGPGGPVPATGRTARADYVYALTMDDQDRVAHMVKIWNAPWSLRELGWA